MAKTTPQLSFGKNFTLHEPLAQMRYPSKAAKSQVLAMADWFVANEPMTLQLGTQELQRDAPRTLGTNTTHWRLFLNLLPVQRYLRLRVGEEMKANLRTQLLQLGSQSKVTPVMVERLVKAVSQTPAINVQNSQPGQTRYTVPRWVKQADAPVNRWGWKQVVGSLDSERSGVNYQTGVCTVCQINLGRSVCENCFPEPGGGR